MSLDYVPPFPSGPGVSSWAGLAGLGIMPALLGMGRLGRRRNPETKRERAQAVSNELSDLCDALESMTRNADCLVGSEAQGTLSPFNAEVNAVVAEIAVLRRRALLAKSRLHAWTFPKIKDDLKRLVQKLDDAESEAAQVLAMPDLTPEAEEALKQAAKDKRLVSQVLYFGSDPVAIQEIADKSGVPLPRASTAVLSLIADGHVEAVGEKFKRVRVESTYEVELEVRDEG